MPPLVGRKRVQNWPAPMTERHWTRHSNYSCVNDWWRGRFSQTAVPLIQISEAERRTLPFDSSRQLPPPLASAEGGVPEPGGDCLSDGPGSAPPGGRGGVGSKQVNPWVHLQARLRQFPPRFPHHNLLALVGALLHAADRTDLNGRVRTSRRRPPE